MHLSLDHLILRSATPEHTLAQLAERAGAPIAVAVDPVGGMASGIVRAGPIDIEVLRIGDEPPPRPHGYGLGLVADVGFSEAVASLRALGVGTSPAPLAAAGEGAQRRTWRASQLQGLLPDPFPSPASTRKPGLRDRMMQASAGLMLRIPAVARAAMRRAGGSMVVLTEYGFDVAAWRAGVPAGPRVLAVELGTGGHRAAWERLPLDGAVPLELDDAGAAGVRRVMLAGSGRPFALGDVAFAFAGG
jgi:hypothetical protein